MLERAERAAACRVAVTIGEGMLRMGRQLLSALVVNVPESP